MCRIVSQLELILFLNVLASAIIVFVRIERISLATLGTSESKICFFEEPIQVRVFLIFSYPNQIP